MEIAGFVVKEQVVVSTSLGIIPKLEVAQRQIVEAFSAALGSGAEDFREQSDALLLFRPDIGFNQALQDYLSDRKEESERKDDL